MHRGTQAITAKGNVWCIYRALVEFRYGAQAVIPKAGKAKKRRSARIGEASGSLAGYNSEIIILLAALHYAGCIVAVQLRLSEHQRLA